MANLEERKKKFTQACDSLKRIQSFDVKTLPRVEEFGTAINFNNAVDPANRAIDLYKQIPIEVLEVFPDEILTSIKTVTDNDFQLLSEILKAQPGINAQTRDNLIQALENSYPNTFKFLSPLISYSVRKSTDFSRLEREARALIQNVTDRARELEADLEKRKLEAEKVLEAVRKVAEEQGVSQQAIYFKTEADKHEAQASTWLTTTIWLTIGLLAYAIFTLFIHKIPFFVPTTVFDSIQLSVSKFLIFITISYFLILSAKNYSAHRHNSVIDRHRQNALATYEALVKAGKEGANRDVVLNKAAECIFSPQPTGFTKSSGSEGEHLSLVNINPGNLNR